MMIGGFLGAGKTTLMRHVAHVLQKEGKEVGLITNDQSHGLVDTLLLRTDGFATEEIGGGCFCCRFDSLVDAAATLTAANRPDMFLAEPVGSCTDLKATVDYPLRQMYGDRFEVLPFTVLVDPVRALRLLGVEAGKRFSDNVRYIYLKQLEEADIILINKSDLLDDERLVNLIDAIHARFKGSKVMTISARSGVGVASWMDYMFGGVYETNVAVPTVDYQRYSEGEAALGWLNANIEISHEVLFDGNALLMMLITSLQESFSKQDEEIAHLKMTLLPSEMATDLGVANLVSTDGQPLLSYPLQDQVKGGLITLNLRAVVDATVLKKRVSKLIASVMDMQKITFNIKEMAAFSPGKPSPTHRIAVLDDQRSTAKKRVV